MGLGGFDLLPAGARPGSELEVSLHWRALAATTANYVVSIQMLDSAGKLVAQQDSPPVGGDYPTSAWEVGSPVLDQHRLAIPAGVPPGTYLVQVVVYAAETLQRLQVGGADHLELARIVVE
jgi:hypothetical protein